MALEKHAHVELIIEQGNHDESSAVWLADMFQIFYGGSSRVSVGPCDDIYHSFQWENVSLFFSHGHGANLNEVGKVFANRFRDMYGQTEYSYGHTAHIHHKKKLKHDEGQLMPVESHSPICPLDDHAKRAGYDSERGLDAICYDRQGERMKMPIRPR